MIRDKASLSWLLLFGVMEALQMEDGERHQDLKASRLTFWSPGR